MSDFFLINNENENMFELTAMDNGFHYWYARDLMQMLGYDSFISFNKAVNKAIGVCCTLGIPCDNNFVQIKRDIDGKQESDYKLSRFGCYLTTMNSDIKKINVAKAQAYFIALAENFRLYIQEYEDIDRVITRDEISQHEKSLSGVVKRAGIESYPLFQNEGYRGLYNLNLRKLKELKGIPDKRSPLDFMGKDELAANLFRITQTELKIKKDGIKGQKNLEDTAYNVGRKVRQTMNEISGVMPEDLPISEDIKIVHRNIKNTHKTFNKIDKPKK